MFIEVGCIAPASIAGMEMKHIAFADIDEQADRTPAPGRRCQLKGLQ